MKKSLILLLFIFCLIKLPAGAATVAGFIAPDTLCISKTLTPMNTSSGGSAPSYRWYFGDGDSSDFTSPPHQYKKSGTYNIRLLAFDHGILMDSAKKKIVVVSPPKAAFRLLQSGHCTSWNLFDLTDSSTGTYNSGIYSWDFGDGQTASGKTASHTYTANGTYTITLAVQSKYGCSDTARKTVKVYDYDAYFELNSDSLQCRWNNTYSFKNMTKGAMVYLWSFGDGEQSSLDSPVHTFKKTGLFIIKFYAVDSEGCSAVYTRQVAVGNISAKFTPDKTNACQDYDFSFVNNSANGSKVVTYTWIFGDGDTVTARNIKHIFKKSGNFTVKMAASDSFCTDTFEANVMVLPSPEVSITGPDTVMAGDTSTYTFLYPNNSQHMWHITGGIPFFSDSTHLRIGWDTLAPSGLIQLMGTDTLSGCARLVEKNITIRHGESGIRDANGIVLHGIYPNPTTRNSTLEIESVKPQWLTLLLYNKWGEAVWRKVVFVPRGNFRTVIPMESLNEGVYILLVTGNHGRLVQRIVKVD